MLVTSNNRTRQSSTGQFLCVILSLDVSGVSGVLKHINLNLPFPLRVRKVSQTELIMQQPHLAVLVVRLPLMASRHSTILH